jgi:8-oxo-dGTP pyrophosphatase MutT (NUDIX family)
MPKPSGRAEQAGVIAVRRSGRGIQVCLIRKGNNPWSIPKGLIEHGDTQRATAVREAWEEAGIRGRLVGRSIGRYQYDKWGDTLTVAVYLMNVRSSQRRLGLHTVTKNAGIIPARLSPLQTVSFGSGDN